jgi:hypothetical protein
MIDAEALLTSNLLDCSRKLKSFFEMCFLKSADRPVSPAPFPTTYMSVRSDLFTVVGLGDFHFSCHDKNRSFRFFTTKRT